MRFDVICDYDTNVSAGCLLQVPPCYSPSQAVALKPYLNHNHWESRLVFSRVVQSWTTSHIPLFLLDTGLQPGDPMFRDIGNLSADDREIAKGFLEMLARRNVKKTKTREAPKMARQTAEAFLECEGIVTLPVDPFAIAKSLDISVEGNPQGTDGVSGMLLRHGNNFGIVYATHITSLGFQRFSVSHELGHIMLPGNPEQIFTDNIHVSRAGFNIGRPR